MPVSQEGTCRVGIFLQAFIHAAFFSVPDGGGQYAAGYTRLSKTSGYRQAPYSVDKVLRDLFMGLDAPYTAPPYGKLTLHESRRKIKHRKNNFINTPYKIFFTISCGNCLIFPRAPCRIQVSHTTKRAIYEAVP